MSSTSDKRNRAGSWRARRWPGLFSSTALALILFAGCGQRPALTAEPCQLAAADGVPLSGHLYRPAQPAPPGLLLVHRIGGEARRWEPLAARAQQAGYLVIAPDLRGHGDSGPSPDGGQDFRNFSPADWQGAHLDLAAAHAELIARGADPQNLFIAGEGLGASLALQYATEHPEMQAVAMLSIGLDDQGIAAEPLLQALGGRPILLIWAEGDAYAAASGRTLQNAAKGFVEVRSYPGSAHGADLFATSTQSIGQIVLWFDQLQTRKETPQNPPKS